MPQIGRERKFEINYLIRQHPDLRVHRNRNGVIVISNGFLYGDYSGSKQVAIVLKPQVEVSPSQVEVYFQGFGERPRSKGSACLKFQPLDPRTTEVKLVHDRSCGVIGILAMAKAGISLLNAHREAPNLDRFYTPPSNPDNLGHYKVSDELLPLRPGAEEEPTTDQEQLKTITDILNAERLVPWRKELVSHLQGANLF